MATSTVRRRPSRVNRLSKFESAGILHALIWHSRDEGSTVLYCGWRHDVEFQKSVMQQAAENMRDNGAIEGQGRFSIRKIKRFEVATR